MMMMIDWIDWVNRLYKTLIHLNHHRSRFDHKSMMMMINYPSCFFSRKKMFQLEQLKQPILQYSNAIRKKKSNVFFTFFFLGWMGLSIMSSTAIFLRPKFSNKWFFMVVSSKTKMKKSSVERRR